jgi:hypothetical protein
VKVCDDVAALYALLLAAVATTVQDPAPVKLSNVEDPLGKLQLAVLDAPVVTE